jgi:hypothetical protein
MIQYQDMTSVWNFAYKMADLINGGHYNNILVYEFHNPITGEQPYNAESGLESFLERSKQFYGRENSPFMGYGIVDEFPSKIELAVKVSDEWFISRHGGFNYYLGTGPHGILHLRQACAKNNVKIMYHSYVDFDKWLIEKFGKPNKSMKNNEPKDSSEFEKIVEVFSRLTISIQDSPEQFNNLNEENIRDRMLTTLNPFFKGRVVREAKNRKGKTDIMIKSKNGYYKYIFEFKIWNGNKTLIQAIEQLQSYLSYHDNYAGIIMLSRNVDFTNILNESYQYLSETYSVTPMDKRFPNEFRISVPYKSDKYKHTQVHLTYINLA